MRICCLKVRHSAIRTLFQSLSSHGHKLTLPMWKRCLWNLVFPLVDTVRHLVSRHVTSMQISDYVQFQIYGCSFCTRNWAGFFCSRRLSRGITGRVSTSLLIVFLFGFSWLRLQLLQRINGMGRSWAQKGASLFTCLSITGILVFWFSISCWISWWEIFHPETRNCTFPGLQST
jgi:hypothetical protein